MTQRVELETITGFSDGGRISLVGPLEIELRNDDIAVLRLPGVLVCALPRQSCEILRDWLTNWLYYRLTRKE